MRSTLLFRRNQGSVKPPGRRYALHPGYFSTPANLTAIDWISDHGAVLHAASKHGLLTGDRAFIGRWLDSIIKGCDFIKHARTIRGHDGVKGLMPPAVATDREVETQDIKSDAWNYRDLTTAVRLLRRIGHPRAEEFEKEAGQYRKTFVAAFLKQADQMPFWTDDGGTKHRVAPVSLSPGGDIFHHFYLDAGPLMLVWARLMDADHPLMRSSLRFFREGPNTRIYDPRGSFIQRPVLVHEISSAQPGSNWNIFHSWRLGDRDRYPGGMYSLLAGAMSRQTHIACEHRHGISGLVRSTLGMLVRLCVIDDELNESQLHLLPLVPQAWLRTDYETVFERMPTEFGPVSIRFKLTEQRRALKVSYETDFRHPPAKVLLHVPPLDGLTKIVINGKTLEVKAGEILTIE